MSAKAKRRFNWAALIVVGLALSVLIFWDIANTVAQKQNRFVNPILLDPLYEPAPKQNSIVGICQSTDPNLGSYQAPLSDTLTYAQVDSITRLAVQRAGGFGDVIQEDDWVVVKPNIIRAYGMSTPPWSRKGTCTDLRVVKSVIQQLVEEGDANRITIAEGSQWRKLGETGTPPGQTLDGWITHWPHYGNLSYEDIVTDFDTLYPGITFDIIDLNYPPYTTDTLVPGGGLAQDSYSMPDAILNCDKLISVAAMKTHVRALVTMTNKNYIGTTPASVYSTTGGGSPYWNHMLLNHDIIDMTICDLISYHPADFGIVECFWGMEGQGPLDGTPIKRNTVVASSDLVATDAISAAIMGFNPWDVDHLHWNHNKGYGIYDLDYIDVNGPTIEETRYDFAKPNRINPSLGFFWGRANRIWLINGTHSGTDINYDYLGGEASVSPVEGDTTVGNVWTILNSASNYIDLQAHFGGGASNCVSYAFTRIIADSTMTAYLRFGSDDGIKIWLNGDSVYADQNTGSWQLIENYPGEQITLQQGVNRLLVKIKNTSGGYGFSMFVTESDGDTPLSICYLIPASPAPEIILNSPNLGAATTDDEMDLVATVVDANDDSMTVWIYGGTDTTALDLFYIEEDVPSGTQVSYNWAAQVLKPDPYTVGLWHFDENTGDTLYDESGNNNDAEIVGAIWTTNGKFGSALHFDGINDYAVVSDAAQTGLDMGLDDFTIEGWIKTTDTDMAPLVAKDAAGQPRYYLKVKDPFMGQHPAGIIGGYISDNTNTYTSVGTQTVIDDEWHYLVAVFDRDSLISLFIDGVEDATTEYFDPISSVGNLDNPTDVSIGRLERLNSYAIGTIDEIRVSKRLLTPSEIADNCRLVVGTYYWKIVANDGENETVSQIRYFHVEPLGPDTLPPEITLNYPPNDSTTTNPYMELSATVTDPDTSIMTVWIYGDTIDANDLLYVQENVPSPDTIIYNWTAPVMEVETGTQGLWHFDESSGDSTYDETTNDNDGALMGPSWTTSGRFGYALSFDGTNDYVVVSDAAQTGLDMGTGDFTIEAWIRTSDPLDDFRPIVAKDLGGAARYYMGITQQPPAGALRGYISDNSNTYYATGTTLVNDGDWHYVVAVYDRDVGVRLFIDAVEDSVTETGTITSVGNLDNATDFSIGRQERGNDYFAGLIDEVRVTNRALTSEEIVANYQLGSTYYWKVRASDGLQEDTSETRHFHVVPAGVATPTLISPADSSVISDTTPEFIWSSTAGVGGSYTLEYGPNLSDPDTTVTGIAETTYTVPDAYALSETTYYWHVQAFNAQGDSSGYQAHPFMFTITTDTLPPEITLNYPPNDFTTTNSYMELSATVSDESPMTVWIYGDTTNASDLLYVQENVPSPDTIIYNWTAPVMEVETGTQGLWHFDESSGDSTYDETANDNDGALMGPSWTTSGRFGYALSLDGTDDYVVVSDAAQAGLDMGTGDFTIEAWVRTSDTLGAPIVAKSASGVPRYYLLITEAESGPGAGHVRAYISDNSNTYYSTSVSTINDDEWHYIAGVYDRDSMIRIFIDTVEDSVTEVGTITSVGNLDNSTDFSIGRDERGDFYFAGLIDEVRVTDQALTPEEITANYQLGSTYHWKVRASDGVYEDTSEIRYFHVEPAGPDTLPPEITLNYPPDDSTTTNTYMELSVTVSDPDTSIMTVWIYGDTTDASDLLYVEEDVPSPDTIIYNWTAPVMEVETGTQGLWHFDESSGDSAYDETTNDNDGSVVGPSWTTDGRFGYALSFDGTDDYVVVSDAAQTGLDMGTGDFTIEAWIRTSDPLDDFRPIVAKDLAGAPRYYMGITNHPPAGALRGYISDNTNTYYATGTTLLNDGDWHYVAAVYDRDVGIRLFIDAAEDVVTETGTITNVGNLDNSTDFSIGRQERGSDYFAGLIDEVRVTDQALTPEEITANYQLGSTYHWKVRASDTAGNDSTSETRQFYVVAVTIPALISPEDSAAINDSTPTFVWSSTAGGGGQYTLQYALDYGFASGLVTVSGISDTSYTVPDGQALSDTSYFWHVQAFNAEGDSSGYQAYPFMFTVDTGLPQVPVLLTPADSSYTNDNTPTFSWSQVTKGSGPSSVKGKISKVGGKGDKATPVTYTLQCATDEGFSDIVIDTAGLTGTSYTVPDGEALADTAYYWHVEAVDQAENHSGYQAHPFMFTVDTDTPDVPTLVSPADSDTVTDRTPTFTWTGVSKQTSSSSNLFKRVLSGIKRLRVGPSPTLPNSSKGRISKLGGKGEKATAVTYTLQCATDTGFSDMVIDTAGLAGTSYTVPGTDALADTTYYWHVEAVDQAENHSGYQEPPFMFTVSTGEFAIGLFADTVDWVNDAHPDYTGDLDGWIENQTFTVWVVVDTAIDALQSADVVVDFEIDRNDLTSFTQGTLFPPPCQFDMYGDPGNPMTDSVAVEAACTPPEDLDVGDYLFEIGFDVDLPGVSDITISTADLRDQWNQPYSMVVTNSKAKFLLGDWHNGDTLGRGDGLVDFEDLVPWSIIYGSDVGDTVGGEICYGMYDIGPTTTGYVYGIPTHDGIVEFEDLMIFSISFGLSHSGVYARPLPPSATGEPLTVAAVPSVPQADLGKTFDLVIKVRGGIVDLRGFHAELSYDPQLLEVVKVTEGEGLESLGRPTFFKSFDRGGRVDIHAAVLGGSEPGVSGEEVIVAVVTFKAIGDGENRLSFEVLDLRNSGNYQLKAGARGGVVTSGSGLIPKVYGLSQNYPNPFNPLTVIEYQIPKDNYVVLRIYNVAGQVIRTLVDEDKRAGFYTVRWDGRNEVGNDVASGIYFLRMVAGRYSSTRKMVILK